MFKLLCVFVVLNTVLMVLNLILGSYGGAVFSLVCTLICCWGALGAYKLEKGG